MNIMPWQLQNYSFAKKTTTRNNKFTGKIKIYGVFSKNIGLSL